MKRERHQLVIERVTGKPMWVPMSKVQGLRASGAILNEREQAAEHRRRERVSWSPRQSGYCGPLVMQMDS